MGLGGRVSVGFQKVLAWFWARGVVPDGSHCLPGDGPRGVAGASGGVDSTVCAWLLHDALGPERLHLLHIDNGFMRLARPPGRLGYCVPACDCVVFCMLWIMGMGLVPRKRMCPPAELWVYIPPPPSKRLRTRNHSLLKTPKPQGVQ